MKKRNKIIISFIIILVTSFIYFLITQKLKTNQEINENTTNNSTSTDDKQITDNSNKNTEKPIQIVDENILDNITIKGELIPTYSNCSYYINCNEESDVKVSYRDLYSKEWKTAYNPVYDNENQMYKGSITNLEEGKDYNVKFEVLESDKVVGRYNMYTTTWNSVVNDKTDVKLSNIINDDVIGKLKIENVNGNENSWINFIGDIEIDSSKSNNNYIIYLDNNSIYAKKSNDLDAQEDSLLLENCSYVIAKDFFIYGGLKNGIRIYNSTDVRINNADVSGYGRNVAYRDDYGVPYSNDNEAINYDSGIMIEESEKTTVEKCYVHSPSFSANSWNNKYESISHPKGTNAMYIKKSKGNNVIRYNDFAGSDNARFNDVIEGWNNTSVEGGLYKDTDVYGNLLAYGNDDGIELDGGQINVRVYNNKITGNLTGISLSPNLSGPSYIFRNEISNLADITGKSNYVIKTSGGEYDFYGDTFIFHNTFIATDYVFANYKEEKRAADVVSRNNILITDKNAIIDNTSDVPQNSYDYDLLCSRRKNLIFKYNSNHEQNGTIAKPSFTNEHNGILSLTGDSKGIDGDTEKLNNFNDDFNGKSADFGAYESGQNYTYLNRPEGLYADSYLINLSDEENVKINISSDILDEKHSVKICKPKEDSWYDATLSDKIISNGKSITCNIKLRDANDNNNHSAIIIKLDTGDSISVCIEK